MEGVSQIKKFTTYYRIKSLFKTDKLFVYGERDREYEYGKNLFIHKPSFIQRFKYLYFPKKRPFWLRRSKKPTLTTNQIEKYLRLRGYVLNNVMKDNGVLYSKGFVCVLLKGDAVEYWHDIPNSKHSFISESKVTHLPIALDYMERI